jgi:hypothetical protein
MKMSAVFAVVLVLVLTAVLVSGCMTRIDLNDFTVPALISEYEDGDWHYYKKRGSRPPDYVLATVILTSVVTEHSIGGEGDYYIVEEDGRTYIMDPVEFKTTYKKLKRLQYQSEDAGPDIE